MVKAAAFLAVAMALLTMGSLGQPKQQPGYPNPLTGEWVSIGGPYNSNQGMRQHPWVNGPSQYEFTLYPGQTAYYNMQPYYSYGGPFGTPYGFYPGMGPNTFYQDGAYFSGYVRPY